MGEIISFAFKNNKVNGKKRKKITGKKSRSLVIYNRDKIIDQNINQQKQRKNNEIFIPETKIFCYG